MEQGPAPCAPWDPVVPKASLGRAARAVAQRWASFGMGEAVRIPWENTSKHWNRLRNVPLGPDPLAPRNPGASRQVRGLNWQQNAQHPAWNSIPGHGHLPHRARAAQSVGISTAKLLRCFLLAANSTANNY